MIPHQLTPTVVATYSPTPSPTTVPTATPSVMPTLIPTATPPPSIEFSSCKTRSVQAGTNENILCEGSSIAVAYSGRTEGGENFLQLKCCQMTVNNVPVTVVTERKYLVSSTHNYTNSPICGANSNKDFLRGVTQTYRANQGQFVYNEVVCVELESVEHRKKISWTSPRRSGIIQSGGPEFSCQNKALVGLSDEQSPDSTYSPETAYCAQPILTSW